MAQQYDYKDEMRAVHLARELKKAKRSIPMGSMGVFMRVTLAIIFMYLIVVSYSMLGITGPVLVSILFLVAFFIPVLYHTVKALMDQRRAQTERISSGEVAEV